MLLNSILLGNFIIVVEIKSKLTKDGKHFLNNLNFHEEVYSNI